MKNINAVLTMVANEIIKQDQKWGADREQHPFVWNAILTEEVGEYSQAILQTEFGGPHAGQSLHEIIHVAAVALQIANSLIDKQDNSVETSSIDEIQMQIAVNDYQTYFGGRAGFDYCCFKEGRIICSGPKEDMLRVASINEGYYVAIVVPVSFTHSRQESEK